MNNKLLHEIRIMHINISIQKKEMWKNSILSFFPAYQKKFPVPFHFLSFYTFRAPIVFEKCLSCFFSENITSYNRSDTPRFWEIYMKRGTMWEY
jgi:hypothetical protein